MLEFSIIYYYFIFVSFYLTYPFVQASCFLNAWFFAKCIAVKVTSRVSSTNLIFLFYCFSKTSNPKEALPLIERLFIVNNLVIFWRLSSLIERFIDNSKDSNINRDTVLSSLKKI